ncbi:MAG: DeoR/GlpR transcriptional regulator, partial [Lentihominibacter sp.]
GGKFNKDTMSVDNASACDIIVGYNIDKAFMAATGYSTEGGIAQDSPSECEIKRFALEHATESYLLIDSSKIGKKALIRYADPDSIKTIITDGAYDGKYKKYFRENGINII